MKVPTLIPGFASIDGASRPKGISFQGSKSPLRNTQQSGDVFVRFGAGKTSYAHPGYVHPENDDLMNQLYKSGGPGAPTRDNVIITFPHYFSTDGKRQDHTSGNLFDDASRMAAVYQDMGLTPKIMKKPDVRITLADTNTFDHLTSYYGGIGVGDTLGPLNLLATKGPNPARVAWDMINGVKSDAFIFGSAPIVADKMGKFQTVQKLKHTLKLSPETAARFADGESPRNLKEKLIFAILRLRIKPEQRLGFKVTMAEIPKELTIISPQLRLKRMKKAEPLAPSQLLLHPDPNTLADTIFTSGTSGKPKGVGLTHKNLVFTVNSLSEAIDGLLKPDDKMLLGLPLFHIFGKAVLLLGLKQKTPFVMLPSLADAMGDREEKPTINDPAEVVKALESMKTAKNEKAVDSLVARLAEPKDKSKVKPHMISNMDKVIKTIDEYGATVLPSIPNFLEKLVDYIDQLPLASYPQRLTPEEEALHLLRASRNPFMAAHPGQLTQREARTKLKNVRMVVSGGAPLMQRTYDGLRKINRNIKILEGYGASETGIVSLNMSGEPGHVGKPLPGVEVQITGEDGRPQQQGQTGEIWVRSPGVAESYIPGTVPAGKEAIVDENGYRHTDDLGFFDENGNLHIMGRIGLNVGKDRGGEPRNSTDYEEAMRKSAPEVLDAMNIFFKPSRELTSTVTIAATSDSALTEERIKEKMAHKLKADGSSGMLIPDHVLVLHQDHLPWVQKDDFKRDGGYKAADAFLKEAIKQEIVVLHDRTAGSRASTTVNQEKLNAFAKTYKYLG